MVTHTKIGIVGSRQRFTVNDATKVLYALSGLVKYPLPQNDRNLITLVSGGAEKCADNFAEQISREYGIPILIYYPDKKWIQKLVAGGLNPRLAFTKAAYERNEKIANDSEYLIAVVAENRKGGTENTIKYFCKKHKKTEEQLIKEGKLILV